MRNFITIAVLLIGSASFAQPITSFEEPGVVAVQYVDTGDPAVAHDLVNNVGEPNVDYVSTGGELGFNARYEPYDSPTTGLTNGAFVGVTDVAPSGSFPYPYGTQGYQISDTDGNFILEFDTVSLDWRSSQYVSLELALSINGDGSTGNYEGDGTVNEEGSDRLRIYVKDLTNATEADLFNSTGMDLDDLVPVDSGTGMYIMHWQWLQAGLLPNTDVQLVIEARMDDSNEAFFFDYVFFSGNLGVDDLNAETYDLFPNPASAGYVNISSNVAGDKSIVVFDVLGKEVINTTLAGDRLNISDLASGLYIIKITQGNATASKKLIVN